MKYVFLFLFIFFYACGFAQKNVEIILFRFEGEDGLSNPSTFELYTTKLDTIRLNGLGYQLFLDSVRRNKEFYAIQPSDELDDFPCYGKITFFDGAKTDSYYIQSPGLVWRKDYVLYSVSCTFVEFLHGLAKFQYNEIRD